MKKVSLFRNPMMLIAVFGLMVTTLWSCGDKSGEENPELEIVLNAPANNATIDLSTVDKVTYNWTQVAGVSSYTLKFSPTEAGIANTEVTVNAGDVSSYDLTSQAADNLLANNTDVAPGASTDMYWTVVPTAAVPNVKTQVRKFNVKRLTVTATPTLEVLTEILVLRQVPLKRKR
jgi:hypothetical protein